MFWPIAGRCISASQERNERSSGLFVLDGGGNGCSICWFSKVTFAVPSADSSLPVHHLCISPALSIRIYQSLFRIAAQVGCVRIRSSVVTGGVPAGKISRRSMDIF